MPWRAEGCDPYRVVVSEIMLQQTQVPRVIEKYTEFLGKFPTIEGLARASREDVIRAWCGLGYNRRALMLQNFAQEVVQLYEGKIPDNPKVLMILSGVGTYTAGSIASFAFNKPEPAIDVNLRRIYMRFFYGRDQGLPMAKEEEKKLYVLVKSSIPVDKSRDLHNALMDFGSLICLREKPLCRECVLQKQCGFFPLYAVKKEKVLFVREKRVEKGVREKGKHVPNRIFRGRIVEFVRKNASRSLSIDDFGMIIKKDFKGEEREWLLGLCEKLRKEGLIDFVLVRGLITFTFR
ncbi:A/G-specific adenine glycosylase [Candidatus Woesearchaeota archaeon]|nr:A/G-specific adenine glycosylase [Candidatus Woesearchaeota archaeon]